MQVVDWFTEPLQYAFMQRALVEVIIMGAVTGVIGAYIVLRGLSFIGDALSHAIFPGIVIAFLLGKSIFIGALVFGALTSTSIAVVATNRRIKEDTAIGVIFSGTFALGIVLISSSRNFTRDLASFLFGNVLGVTEGDIYLSLGVGVLVVLMVVVFYRQLLIVSFDRVAAKQGAQAIPNLAPEFAEHATPSAGCCPLALLQETIYGVFNSCKSRLPRAGRPLHIGGECANPSHELYE